MSPRHRRPPRAGGAPATASASATTDAAHPSSTGPASRRLRWYAAVLVAAVALTYANSLSGPFILDDQATVVQNPQLRNAASVLDLLTPAPDSPVAGRPLASLTFAANYAVHGLDVRGYHVVNIALHAACALLLLLLVASTLDRPRVRAQIGTRAPDVAFGAALIWAVHPLNSEVVNYISQRTESLMAAFYLLTLYAAVRAADRPAATGGIGPHRGWAMTAIVACAAGMASKESMATAPLIVALYDRAFLFESWRSAFSSRRRLYVGLAATWTIAAVLLATGPRAAVAGLSSGVSPWTYLLNQARIIPQYLRLTIWPDSLVVFYGWPAALTLGDVLPGVVVLAAALAATLVVYWRRPAAGFPGMWFFITLAPASSILPVATEVGAERRMYLPLMALSVIAMLGVAWLLKAAARRGVLADVSRPWHARAAVSLAVALAVAFALAVVTVRRNGEYESALTLARTVVDRRPTGVAHHVLAEQLALAGRADEAVVHLRAAVAAGNSRAGYLLGRILSEQGRRREAIAVLEAFLRTAQLPYRPVPIWLEPPLIEVIPARFALGRAWGLEGEWDKAAEQGRLILEAVPSHVGAHGLLGDALFARQQWQAAAAHYREYLQRQPADVPALINYGITQVASERFEEAIDSFTRATRIDPANARARELLALARQDRAAILGEP